MILTWLDWIDLTRLILTSCVVLMFIWLTLSLAGLWGHTRLHIYEGSCEVLYSKFTSRMYSIIAWGSWAAKTLGFDFSFAV